MLKLRAGTIKTKGVPNGEIKSYPTGAKYFSVNDPDGNFCFIVQSLSKSLELSKHGKKRKNWRLNSRLLQKECYFYF